MVESIYVVYALVVLYATCYQLQAPLEPYLVDKLVEGDGASEAYANLQSYFSLVQMVGSLVVGALIDRVGLRAMFAINFVGCAASYALLANASTLTALYVSKLPTVVMAGFLCAQTAAAKLTPAGTERASALGRLTTAYTVGGTIGPGLGGYLGVTAAARLAVLGSLLAVALTRLLPSMDGVNEGEAAPLVAKKKKEQESDGKTGVGAWLRSVRVILSLVWPLVLVREAHPPAKDPTAPAVLRMPEGMVEFAPAQFRLCLSPDCIESCVRLAPCSSLRCGRQKCVLGT